MTEPFLSETEVCRLTGYIQPKRQAAFLTEMGIRFYRNRLGVVIVPRSAVDATAEDTEDAPFQLNKIA